MGGRKKSKSKCKIKTKQGGSPGQKPAQNEFEHPVDTGNPGKTQPDPDFEDYQRFEGLSNDSAKESDSKLGSYSPSMQQFEPNGKATQKRDTVKNMATSKNRSEEPEEPLDAFGQPLTGMFADILASQLDGNQTDESSEEPVRETGKNPDETEEQGVNLEEMDVQSVSLPETDAEIDKLLGGSDDEDASETSGKTVENGSETDENDTPIRTPKGLEWMADAAAAMKAAEKAQREAMALNHEAFKARKAAEKSNNDARLVAMAELREREADKANKLAQNITVNATTICGNFAKASAGGPLRSSSESRVGASTPGLSRLKFENGSKTAGNGSAKAGRASNESKLATSTNDKSKKRSEGVENGRNGTGNSSGQQKIQDAYGPGGDDDEAFAQHYEEGG